MTTTAPRFRSGPWTDPVAPDEASAVDGVRIVERLLSRTEPYGALVRLADGRLAVLGSVLATGRPKLVKLFALRRAAATSDPADRAWWSSVGRAALA